METYILDDNDKLHVKISIFVGISGLIASIILKEVAPMPIWLSMIGFGWAAGTYRVIKKSVGKVDRNHEDHVKIGLLFGVGGLIVAILLRDFGGVTSWISVFAFGYGITTAQESSSSK